MTANKEYITTIQDQFSYIVGFVYDGYIVLASSFVVVLLHIHSQKHNFFFFLETSLHTKNNGRRNDIRSIYYTFFFLLTSKRSFSLVSFACSRYYNMYVLYMEIVKHGFIYDFFASFFSIILLSINNMHRCYGRSSRVSTVWVCVCVYVL